MKKYIIMLLFAANSRADDKNECAYGIKMDGNCLTYFGNEQTIEDQALLDQCQRADLLASNQFFAQPLTFSQKGEKYTIEFGKLTTKEGIDLYNSLKNLANNNIEIPETIVTDTYNLQNNLTNIDTTFVYNKTAQQVLDLITKDNKIAILNHGNAECLGNNAIQYGATRPQEQDLMFSYPIVYASYLIYMKKNKPNDGKYLVGNQIAITDINKNLVMLDGVMFIANSKTETETETEKKYNNKIQTLFCIADDLNITDFIVGAWGCGVYGNEPEKIARYFKSASRRFILHCAVPGKNYYPFSQVFQSIETQKSIETEIKLDDQNSKLLIKYGSKNFYTEYKKQNQADSHQNRFLKTLKNLENEKLLIPITRDFSNSNIIINLTCNFYKSLFFEVKLK